MKNTLLKNINIDLTELSNLKDELFIQNIDKIKIIEGIIEFMKLIKKYGHKICIVTNCNRIVANEIINYIKITEYVDYLISNNDCNNAKPHPEP